MLADWILAHLVGPDGRLLDRPAMIDDGPEANARPLPVIEGGAEIADGLLRLAAAAGRRDYGEAAAKALAGYVDDYRSYGSFAAGYALALMRLLEHPTHVAVVGRRDDERTSALRRAALALATPLRTVASFDPAHDTEIVAREGYLDSDVPAAYVCSRRFLLAAGDRPCALSAVAAGAGAGAMPPTRTRRRTDHARAPTTASQAPSTSEVTRRCRPSTSLNGVPSATASVR